MIVNLNTLKFTSAKQNVASTPIENKPPKVQTQLNSLSSLAYKDYNISFGGRLFRSPENFYEQNFNEQNMPKSLHEYVYESFDSDFRKTIPPSQAMKEVFGKLKFAKDLEMVRLLFREEPLFEDLTTTPHKKSREGLLGELSLLKEKDKPLFKNGDDDLGLYILKKIYLEGKTLKEINKDFQKDTSVVYKGISDIVPGDYSAYGIKFPHRSFWKSFIATREDFPYVYIPRKASENSEIHTNNSDSNRTDSNPVVRKKREPMSYEQKKKMSEFMTEWHNNLTPEQKADLKRKHKVAMEESPFYQYFGEIVSVAQDKINLSDKLAEYMEKVYGDSNYLSYMQDKNEKRSEIMKRFWKENDILRKDYSKAMLEIISEFDMAYGDNGENYEILRLAALGRGIKKNVAEGRVVRDMLKEQARLENMPKQADESVKIVKKEEVMPSLESGEVTIAQLERMSINMGAKIYKLILEDGSDLNLVLDLEAELLDNVANELPFFPKSFVNSYKQFILSHPLMNDKAKLSSVLQSQIKYDMENNNGVLSFESFGLDPELLKSEFVQKQLYSNDELAEIYDKIRGDFNKKYNKNEKACSQVLLELVSLDLDGKNLNALGLVKTANIGEYLQTILEDKTLDKELTDRIEKNYNDYRRDLSSSEINKIYLKIMQNLPLINFNNMATGDLEPGLIVKALLTNVKKDPVVRKLLSDVIKQNNMITKEDGHARCLLDDNAPKKLIDAKLEQLLLNFMVRNDLSDLRFLASVDKETLDTQIRPYNMTLYYSMLKFVESLNKVSSNKAYSNSIKKRVNNY